MVACFAHGTSKWARKRKMVFQFWGGAEGGGFGGEFERVAAMTGLALWREQRGESD